MNEQQKTNGSSIEEQNRLLAALKVAEERSAMLAAIVNSSDDAIISKNLEGIVTSWNLSAQRIFGYCAEEMIGESIVKIIPEDRLEEEPKILSVLKSGLRVDHFETKGRLNKGN
ncbi:PAS domain S-box protein [Pedobacter steynii]